MEDKEYAHYTGWIGGRKVTSAKELLQNILIALSPWRLKACCQKTS